MDLPTTADEARVGRLAALEDEVRRRLWDREREGYERAFDEMIRQIAREQYAAEAQSHRTGIRPPFEQTVV